MVADRLRPPACSRPTERRDAGARRAGPSLPYRTAHARAGSVGAVEHRHHAVDRHGAAAEPRSVPDAGGAGPGAAGGRLRHGDRHTEHHLGLHAAVRRRPGRPVRAAPHRHLRRPPVRGGPRPHRTRHQCGDDHARQRRADRHRALMHDQRHRRQRGGARHRARAPQPGLRHRLGGRLDRHVLRRSVRAGGDAGRRLAPGARRVLRHQPRHAADGVHRRPGRAAAQLQRGRQGPDADRCARARPGATAATWS